MLMVVWKFVNKFKLFAQTSKKAEILDDFVTCQIPKPLELLKYEMLCKYGAKKKLLSYDQNIPLAVLALQSSHYLMV